MAIYYDKNGDMSVVLDPREPHGRQMGFASLPWTECRIGAFISAVASSDPNTAYAAETISVSSVFDYMMIGLKNSDVQDTVIGQADCQFWGITGIGGSTTALIGTTGTPVLEGSVTADNAGGYIRFAASDGTTVNGATVGGTAAGNRRDTLYMNTKLNVAATTNYAAFCGLRFVIANRGLSSQTVTIHFSNNWNGSTGGITTDTSLSALRTLLTNFTTHQNPNNSGALAANDGATAFPIPDAMYFLFPFLSNVIRIHSKEALFIA